ncbi:zinc finger protein 888-like [Diorhabda sublineata]|uniref:zinc finger protein 888-like n=1 Tax=Diorhabda sublineata TaxID=1163346 RepID=UPI0024E13D17|nr:zinc finger protein 888-like [Diorhabda sublineata]
MDVTAEIKEELRNDIDISNLCRVCLSTKNLVQSLEPQLSNIYEKLTELKIESEGIFPLLICDECLTKLQDISNFIQKCKNTYNYLEKILKNREQDNNETVIDDTFVDNDDDSEDNFEIESPRKKNRLKKSSCETCGKTFSRCGALARHMKIHLKIKPFQCKGCDKSFTQKSTLDRHFLTHTGDKPFQCNLCDKHCARKSQIIQHIKKQHSKVNAKDYSTAYSERDKMVYFDDNQSSKQTSTLGIDTEVIKEEDVNAKSEPILEQIIDIEVPKMKKKRMELCLCNLCGKEFKRREYLRNHMAIHNNIKPYTCQICGSGFTQRQALSRHKLVHTKERPYQCNICGKTFTRKEKLTDHIRCHEEGVDPHLCQHCGRRFKDREYLRKHLRYYLMGDKGRWKKEAKKCLCPECGKEVHSEAYLKIHLLSHKGEKPFKCDQCDKKFTVNATLQHHLNIHKGVKPFACPQCTKAFRTNHSLKIHQMMHSGVRPYKCNTCDKGFVRSSHLKRHIRLH